MLKENLQSLYEKKYDMSLCNRLNEISNKFREEELFYLLSEIGLNIGNNIILNYYPGAGYRCFNLDKAIKGENPLCRVIEKFLNKEMLKMLEGRGITDIVKDYTDAIYSLFEEGKYKNQLDLDYTEFPLMDLRIEFILSDSYHCYYDPGFSNVKDNNIDKIKILGLIAHELNHVKEYFEIHKKIIETKIDISPTWVNIQSVFKEMNIIDKNEYYHFLYLIYLSLDNEMNARVSQVYHYLYYFKIKDEDVLFDKLKLHKNWEYFENLKDFNYVKFIDNNIHKIGENGLIKITNELIDKFKDKELNKRTKLLNFIDKHVNDLNDLNKFYEDWSIYFRKKSEKHLEKFKWMIKEVIEDLNGNRPYTESYRTKIELRDRYNDLS
jgi:hypothetical protein